MYQATLPGLRRTNAALEQLALANATERGAVFTRREVVAFILDLVDYTPSEPLHTRRILEPSFGGGDFLLEILDRLIQSYLIHPRSDSVTIADLKSCVRAVELHERTYERTREKLSAKLTDLGFTAFEVDELLSAWLIQGDFLLTPFAQHFSYIVGNPPYIRQELIPRELLDEYRRRYDTIFDRADIYIPFIEKSLGLLMRRGRLGFICSDRWMKNRYGGLLRKLVAEHYHLRYYVDMVDVDAFHSDVIAYPAIIVLENSPKAPTRVAFRPTVSVKNLTTLAQALQKGTVSDTRVRTVDNVSNGGDPWIFQSTEKIDLVRRLESRFPTLEEAGCKVGIGVATGADHIFIRQYDQLDVEPDRKLPLVRTQDIRTGIVVWQGAGVINPFNDDGSLVDLRSYPKLAKYLGQHKERILSRHVAKRNPRQWYRTIDRIDPSLAHRPKLLIPDIKGSAHIVYEEGQFYPHHNLYYIVSRYWDLRVLRVVLASGIASLFVSAYSPKMRGDYLRFQAQYLRRIRIPFWRDVSDKVKAKLISADQKDEMKICRSIVFDLYQLTNSERSELEALAR